MTRYVLVTPGQARITDGPIIADPATTPPAEDGTEWIPEADALAAGYTYPPPGGEGPDPLSALDPAGAALSVPAAVQDIAAGLNPTVANPTQAERLAALEVLVAELARRATT